MRSEESRTSLYCCHKQGWPTGGWPCTGRSFKTCDIHKLLRSLACQAFLTYLVFIILINSIIKNELQSTLPIYCSKSSVLIWRFTWYATWWQDFEPVAEYQPLCAIVCALGFTYLDAPDKCISSLYTKINKTQPSDAGSACCITLVLV